MGIHARDWSKDGTHWEWKGWPRKWRDRSSPRLGRKSTEQLSKNFHEVVNEETKLQTKMTNFSPRDVVNRFTAGAIRTGRRQEDGCGRNQITWCRTRLLFTWVLHPIDFSSFSITPSSSFPIHIPIHITSRSPSTSRPHPHHVPIHMSPCPVPIPIQLLNQNLVVGAEVPVNKAREFSYGNSVARCGEAEMG